MSKFRKNGHLKLPVVFVIVAASTLVLIMAGAYIYQLFNKKDEPTQSSYSSSEQDVEKNDEYTASMEYSGNVTINSDDGSIKLYFKNPEKSRKTVSLEIVGDINGQNTSIAEVKEIIPGEEIRNLQYDPSKGIEKGKYQGKFILHFYNDEGIEEIINSAIVVNIIVN